jgi:acetyl esterase/lipase
LPLREGSTLNAIFGGNDPATQPISYVAPGAPPALLLTGRHDRIVEPSNSERLAARLHTDSDAVTLKTYRWVGHLAIIGALAPPLRFLAPVLRDVTAFVGGTPAPATRHAEAKP